MADKANIYILTGESYMISRALCELKQGVQNPELNVTEYKTMPRAQDLIAACAEYPFLADKRLIAVRDSTVLTASGSAEEAKTIADYLDKLPESTVLVMCSESSPDKRRTLYKKAAQMGVVREFAVPTPAACADFVVGQAAEQGARVSAKTAQLLVSYVGCDYYALENEMAKLAVYCDFGEITPQHIEECASRSLEYNVFEIHKLFVEKKAEKARTLLADILAEERPEALIGLFARKIRDMYKVKAMRDAGFCVERITMQLKMKSFAVQMLCSECARFSAAELREGLKLLADLDYGIKCGRRDAVLSLHETLPRVYGL